MPTRTHIGTAVISIAVAAAALGGACVDEKLNQLTDAGGGGQGGEALGGGMGGTPIPDRGDPANFPGTCVDSCEEACTKLQDCGADNGDFFSIDNETCLSLCELSEGGPLWDDISANFKCCASQDECSEVQHCGGWLNHPDVQQSCQKLCGCFFSSAELGALADNHTAPAPYRFADHAVMVALPSTEARVPHVPNVLSKRSGKYLRATFGEGTGMHTLAQLASLGQLLPTFVDSAGRVSAATGRVFVRGTTSAKLATARSITQLSAGSTPTKVSFSKTLYQSVYADPWDAVDAVNAMRAAGLDAELDMLREYRLRYTPNDPLFPDQWQLRNQGQGQSMSGVDTRASEAWDITTGDPQVLLAIFDNGVDLEHPDFAGRLEPGINIPTNWRDEMEAGNYGGHGTWVSGFAASAIDDLKGGAGICPNCRIIPALLALTDFQGGFMVTDAEAAQRFEAQVDAGAWVINNSWGLTLGDAQHAEAEQDPPELANVIRDAFDYAETSGRGGLGTVIVYASGNDNTQLDAYSTYATNVAVGAVGDVGLKAFYSAFGPELTLTAPSGGGLTGAAGAPRAGGGYTAEIDGTSFSAPMVTGVLGLIFSANPSLTAAQARDILKASATKIDPVFGAYDQDGHSNYHGAGLVNAYVAVRMAEGTCTDAADCPAPSDDCGSSCGTKTACEPCRVQADCAADHACQALPSIGRMVCVKESGGANCELGYNEVNGYCVPLAETCGVCLGSEECNGRDDDCNGEADEDFACDNGARCFVDSLPCADGTACAATVCVPECEDDEDCEEGALCRTLKDQYGNVSGARGCLIDQGGGGCQAGCSVLASSLDDEKLESFNMCMMNGLVDCNTVQGCAVLLPINF